MAQHKHDMPRRREPGPTPPVTWRFRDWAMI